MRLFFFLPTLLVASITAYCPVVICPGFGLGFIDYDKPIGQLRDSGLKSTLSKRGFDSENIHIVPIKRAEWLKVLFGLFDFPNFYLRKNTPNNLAYGWYIKKLKKCIELAHEKSGRQKVVIIAHSAGGWLSRAAMGNGYWSSFKSTTTKNVRTSELVQCLVTLGSIHKPPKNESMCITRGALKHTDTAYPGLVREGAFLKSDGIEYVTIGAVSVCGKSESYKNRKASRTFSSYLSVAGDGNLIGDGIVPYEYTQLDGATQIQLEGVYHTFYKDVTKFPSDTWYGSEEVIDQWLPIVIGKIEKLKKYHSN